MTLALAQPWLLWLLPLALLPLLAGSLPLLAYPALERLPPDPLSAFIEGLLRLIVAGAMVALVLGLAGLHRPAQSVERIGQGAQIVVLLDRSSSMDRPFAGSRARNDNPLNALTRARSESKGEAARRLLAAFAERRRNDLFGMLVFSTNPIEVLPLTAQPELVQAAVAAGALGRGLAKTDLGAGLIRAFEFFENLPYTGSRLVLLVSDGAAKLDPVTQEHIRNLMTRTRTALYWLYLRTQDSPGLTATVGNSTAHDMAEIAPEQLLHQFFQSLELPYRAYPAENPEALEQAIEAVNRLQTLPIRYQERIPPQPLDRICYAVAFVLLALRLGAGLLEVRAWCTKPV